MAFFNKNKQSNTDEEPISTEAILETLANEKVSINPEYMKTQAKKDIENFLIATYSGKENSLPKDNMTNEFYKKTYDSIVRDKNNGIKRTLYDLKIKDIKPTKLDDSLIYLVTSIEFQVHFVVKFSIIHSTFSQAEEKEFKIRYIFKNGTSMKNKANWLLDCESSRNEISSKKINLEELPNSQVNQQNNYSYYGSATNNQNITNNQRQQPNFQNNNGYGYNGYNYGNQNQQGYGMNNYQNYSQYQPPYPTQRQQQNNQNYYGYNQPQNPYYQNQNQSQQQNIGQVQNQNGQNNPYSSQGQYGQNSQNVQMSQNNQGYPNNVNTPQTPPMQTQNMGNSNNYGYNYNNYGYPYGYGYGYPNNNPNQNLNPYNQNQMQGQGQRQPQYTQSQNPSSQGNYGQMTQIPNNQFSQQYPNNPNGQRQMPQNGYPYYGYGCQTMPNNQNDTNSQNSETNQNNVSYAKNNQEMDFVDNNNINNQITPPIEQFDYIEEEKPIEELLPPTNNEENYHEEQFEENNSQPNFDSLDTTSTSIIEQNIVKETNESLVFQTNNEVVETIENAENDTTNNTCNEYSNSNSNFKAIRRNRRKSDEELMLLEEDFD